MNQDQYLEALLTLPKIYSPIISRDRKWVAWTAFGVGAAADVYVAPTDGSASPMRITDTPEVTAAVSWTPDSRSVLVRQDHQGDERFRLFRVDIDRPGTMIPLTEPSPQYFLRGGQLHPDGQRLVYAANLDEATGQEIEPTWVYLHDLSTGQRRPLACPEKPAYYIPQLNEQGTHILYRRKDLHPSGEQVWL